MPGRAVFIEGEGLKAFKLTLFCSWGATEKLGETAGFWTGDIGETAGEETAGEAATDGEASLKASLISVSDQPTDFKLFFMGASVSPI